MNAVIQVRVNDDGRYQARRADTHRPTATLHFMTQIKRSLLGLVAALLVLVVGIILAHAQEFIRVKRAVDGDTIVLESGERVRLIGVDTPENVDPRRPVEYFGKEASAFTQRKVEGKLVRLQYDHANAARGHKDNTPQRRTLAYVFLEDGMLLNAEIIRQGFGHALIRMNANELIDICLINKVNLAELRFSVGNILVSILTGLGTDHFE